MELNAIWQKVTDWLTAAGDAPEVRYSVLLVVIFLVPRIVSRIGIPIALSTFFLGIMTAEMIPEINKDPTLTMFATLGIIALFLFAGMEIEPHELSSKRRAILEHVLARAIMVVISVFVITHVFEIESRASWLVSLALLTPSVGFILDTLNSSNLSGDTKFWIRSKAIAAEIVALLAMFIVMQSASFSKLILSSLMLLALILILPRLFRFFVKKIAPFAPNSEFAFFIITALIFGLITKAVGAYYLVGAFVVGVAAKQFESIMPELRTKNFLHSVNFFAAFFIPFYFFKAGALVRKESLSWESFLIGLVFLAIFIPIRLFQIIAHRKLSLGESVQSSLPVAASLLPNLVFGLVLSELLNTYFTVPPEVIGGLVYYTVGVTLVPPLILKVFWQEPALAQIATPVDPVEVLNSNQNT